MTWKSIESMPATKVWLFDMLASSSSSLSNQVSIHSTSWKDRPRSARHQSNQTHRRHHEPGRVDTPNIRSAWPKNVCQKRFETSLRRVPKEKRVHTPRNQRKLCEETGCASCNPGRWPKSQCKTELIYFQRWLDALLGQFRMSPESRIWLIELPRPEEDQQSMSGAS